MATIKMATKDQERAALEQIKKIIAELGNNSYIAMAMDGMIADAEENIENDFALSWKDRAETAAKRLEKAQEETARISKELELAKKNLAEASERREEYWRQMKSTEKTALDNLNELTALRNKAQKQEEEIVRLKVKCFDLMEQKA